MELTAGKDVERGGDVWVCDVRGQVLLFDTHYGRYSVRIKIGMRDCDL